MNLLDIDDLSVDYGRKGFRRAPVRVLKHVSLSIRPGETVGLVGESGSGKTTLGRAVLGLVPVAEGTVSYDGRDVSGLGKRARRALAHEIQVVFQDPYTSLNPSLTVGEIIAEPLQGMSRKDARATVTELLEQVGLPVNSYGRKPRHFSGGQRQRVAIARALALNPRLIVCDEPVSALDLSTQARVLDLFKEVQERTGVAYLFISHDLAVVRHLSHRVAVMYRGEIVEQGDAEQVTSRPMHPYTKRLLLAAPTPDPDAQATRREERRRFLASVASEG